MLQHCAYFIKWFYLDPPAEEMESDSVIDMPTATVSEDQIDVEIVAVFPRFSNEAYEAAVEGPKWGAAAVVHVWIWTFR